MDTYLIDTRQVESIRRKLLSYQRGWCLRQIEPSKEIQAEKTTEYKVDEFVQEAVALHITPFMLDSYRHEYEDMLVLQFPCLQDVRSDDHF